MVDSQPYFESRFTPDQRREVLWQTLCRHYFSGMIANSGCVLELGAGYGHFINNIQAKRRIAIDLWDGFQRHLQPDVEAHVGAVDDLSFLEDRSVDFAFASNLFEHVTQDQLAQVLKHLARALKPGGTLNILQPNYYYAFREYFDDYTHRTVYTHTSMCDFLVAHGYRVTRCMPRFLPLTIKSRFPVSPLLIRLYLLSPWKAMGKQMLIQAQPDSASPASWRCCWR